jgi:hypothetical protein
MFERGNAKIRNDLNEKLQIETCKLTKLVQEVRSETEQELISVKTSLQGLSKDVNDKLKSHADATKAVANNVERQIELHEGSVDKRVGELKGEIKNVRAEMNGNLQIWQKRAGESIQNLHKELERVESESKGHLELMNSEVNAIKAKLCAYTAVGSNSTALPPPDSNARGNTTESAKTVNVHNMSETATPNHDVLINCTSSVHGNVSDINSANVNHVSCYPTNSCLLPSEVPMPFFSDSRKINPMSHIKQLENYFELRGVPKQLQLAIALRSITDPAAQSWISAISQDFSDYDQFKAAFIKAFWNSITQGNVRRSIYQDKYNKQGGLSWSAHFLKYAVLASHLRPKMADSELISALFAHFPTFIQRSCATVRIDSIQDAVEFLQRLEAIEGNEGYKGLNHENANVPGPQPFNTNERRRGNNHYVRQTNLSHSESQGQTQRHWRNNRNYNRYESNNGRRNENSFPRDHEPLNPNAPPYQNQVARNARSDSHGSNNAIIDIQLEN